MSNVDASQFFLDSFKALPNVTSLKPYVAGKPIEETKKQYKVKNVIKLASNENPLGPSPKALQAYRKASNKIHLYPDASHAELKIALARHLKASPEELIIGNGSNEVIELILKAFGAPGAKIATSQFAFIAYKISAQIQGLTTLESPATADLRFDLVRLLAVVAQDPAIRFVFIANPNNPTGTYNSTSEMTAFLEGIGRIAADKRPLVILDCAYNEYVRAADFPNPFELFRKYSPFVVVLGTFSKIYGIAGLRVGYGLAHPDLNIFMQRVRMPFNVPLPALDAATAALTDKAFVQKSVKLNEAGKRFFQPLFKKHAIPYLPTQGNFFMIRVTERFARTGSEVFEECLKQGVIFRPVTNYGLGDYLRLSIGTESENRRAWKVLSSLFPEFVKPGRKGKNNS